ncbi:MAG: hypothetical protein HY042_13110, partial [Spirochaetia bacterium]|nr:hypothetical protein [Spirochaetia bacterium]
TSDGDVKYHLGFSNDITTPSGNPVHLSLGFNPSHLEVINPVVMGSVRARQTRGADRTRDKHLALLVHGDAAFAGQGINYECINMCDLKGYSVGGTFHVVVNNQIGFTTNPTDSRSTPYATDLAKLLMVPIFHVNADDPEACYRAVRLSMEWRQTYHTDAFIDLICYRRWGHNETDEPAFTQPLMYSRIKEHPTTVALYEQQLLRDGVAQNKIHSVKESVQQDFESAFKRVQSDSIRVQFESLAGNWTGFRKEDPHSNPDTGISRETLQFIGERVTTVPSDFRPNPKIARLLSERRSMVTSDAGKVDWGMGEMLTLGSLLTEGYNIRFSGQDVKRGTFSHRHAGLIDVQNGNECIPLAAIKDGQGTLEMVNSLLSEEAALGFEFGYSLAEPRTLVIWEAQFGDFANGAQVIIDQFISSCEAKWHRMSGAPARRSKSAIRFSLRQFPACSGRNQSGYYAGKRGAHHFLFGQDLLRACERP